MDAEVIVVFGRELCADTVRARSVLDASGILYIYVDVAADETQRLRAQDLAGGRENIPVIVLADGRVLIEPSDEDFIAALRAQ